MILLINIFIVLGGEKKHVNGTEKKLKISKIVNIDELDEKENLRFENNFKEDILIDFNTDISSVSSKQPKDFLSRHNELAGLKFEEFTVFDSPQPEPEPEPSTSTATVAIIPPPRPPPPVISTTSKITRDLFEMDDPESVVLPKPETTVTETHSLFTESFKCEVKPESIEPIRFTESVSSTFFSACSGTFSSQTETLVSSNSKYYSPPTESGLMDSQSIKNRYYSSVCSNCDFAALEPVNPYNSYLGEQSSCQCCGDFFAPCSTNSCMPNGPHCYNGCADMCSSQPPTYFPPMDALPPPVLPDFDSQAEESDADKPNAYQTKVCKDFIEELEANFARLGQVKVSDQNGATSNGASTVYPTINPPPRPYKTRRPAPPPPSQKKVN